MRSVVYVDMLVAVNFILDFFLLLGAKLLSGSVTSRWRCLLGAGLASLFSLVLLLPPLPLALQLLIKVAGSVLPVLAAFRYTGPRQMVKAAVWFLLLNFFLAGAVFFVMYTFSAPGIEQNNLALYFNISPVILIMSVLAVLSGAAADLAAAGQAAAGAAGAVGAVAGRGAHRRLRSFGHRFFPAGCAVGLSLPAAQLSGGERPALPAAARSPRALLQRRGAGGGKRPAGADDPLPDRGGGEPAARILL